MAKPVNITSSGEFDKIVASNKVVVVDFYADWCGPCKAIAPHFESMSVAESKPGRVSFCKVNVDTQSSIARRYSVTAMPTFITIVNGSVKDTIKGANPGGLRSAISSAIASAGSGAKAGAAFQSKGQVLGSGSTVGQGRAPLRVNMPDISSLIPEGFVGAVVRFFGLYFATLFSLDPKVAAQQSSFRLRD